MLNGWETNSIYFAIKHFVWLDLLAKLSNRLWAQISTSWNEFSLTARILGQKVAQEMRVLVLPAYVENLCLLYIILQKSYTFWVYHFSYLKFMVHVSVSSLALNWEMHNSLQCVAIAVHPKSCRPNNCLFIYFCHLFTLQGLTHCSIEYKTSYRNVSTNVKFEKLKI